MENTPTVNPTIGMAKHWSRPDVLAIGRDPRFEYRMVDPEHVGKWISQGFVVDNDAKMKNQEVQRMAAGTGGYRQMVLMKCIKSVGKERREYYIQQHEKRMRATNKGTRVSSNALTIGPEGTAGAVGRHVLQTVLTDEQGMTRNTTQVFTPGDVDPAMTRELTDLAKAQQEERPLK